MSTIPVSIIGFIFIVRMIQNLNHQNTFFKKGLITSVVCFFVFLMLFNFFFLISNLALCFVFLLFGSLLQTVCWLEKKYQHQQLQKQLGPLLDKMVLAMNMGRSFRESMGVATQTLPPFQKQILNQIYSFVVFMQHEKKYSKDPFIQDIVCEFKKIDGSAHRSIDRIKSFRQKIKIEERFRHKSRKAMKQARVQSIVMLLLYSAIFVFVLGYFGWKDYQHLFLVSILLFLVGFFWVFFSGRRYRWKV